jgi:hypothetical protein
VDEDEARQAVLHMRPVLTTFCLSESGWEKFGEHFENQATRGSVLTRAHMAPHRSLPDDGGHAVVLVSCNPHSLTFLNSWGHQWGNNGSFSIEDHTVLEMDGASGPISVRFYDVFWLQRKLTEKERESYDLKAYEVLRTRAEQHPSIFELEVRCPRCSTDSPIANFFGNIREVVCPRCDQSFAPEPGNLMQALYVRNGPSDSV